MHAVAVAVAVAPAVAVAAAGAVAVAVASAVAAVAVAVAVAEAVWLPATDNEEPVEGVNDQRAMRVVERFDWDEIDHLTCHSSGHLPRWL